MFFLNSAQIIFRFFQVILFSLFNFSQTFKNLNVNVKQTIKLKWSKIYLINNQMILYLK